MAKGVGGKWSVSQCEMATLLVVPIPDCLIAFRHIGCDKKKKKKSQ
jgi:hypothetical protein